MFSGLSLTHGLRLIDLQMSEDAKEMTRYIEDDRNILYVLFKDTFYLLRFTEVLIENIKRSHTTLSYIMRSQYRDADTVYKTLLDQNSTMRSMSSICRGTTSNYYNDVFKYLISPQLKKYGMYSPTVSYMIYLSLVNKMYTDYVSKAWQETDKEHIHRIIRIDIDYIESLVTIGQNNIPEALLKLMQEEISSWRQQYARHFKKRTR